MADRVLYSVLKRPDGSCSVLQLEAATNAAGESLEFWVEVAQVAQGLPFAQQIVDRMNTPARARAAAKS